MESPDAAAENAEKNSSVFFTTSLNHQNNEVISTPLLYSTYCIISATNHLMHL